MFISFFCIATEPYKNKYPIIESIKSVLPVADEVVVIFGRGEKSSEREVKLLSEKVKVYRTDLWPVDWSYDVMTYHFDFGLKKCKGDFCVKFDIDYIFKFRNDDILRKLFEKNKEKYHKIYLPKYNYLDKNHWMIYPKGIYCINKNLILKENNGDEDAFYVGNRNYVNELIVDGNIEEFVYEGNEIKVFNYDCSFMTYDLFYEKHFRWYNAYYKKWGNLNHFGLTVDILNDKEKLVNFVVERTKERIDYAIKTGKVHFDNFLFNPSHIRGKLRGLKKEQYGYNFFGKIKIAKILYEDVLLNDTNNSRIKFFLEKLVGEKINDVKISDDYLKISKFCII